MSTAIEKLRVDGNVFQTKTTRNESKPLNLPRAPEMNSNLVFNAGYNVMPSNCGNIQTRIELEAILKQKSPRSSSSKATPVAKKMDYLSRVKDSNRGLSSMDIDQNVSRMPTINFQLHGQRVRAQSAPEPITFLPEVISEERRVRRQREKEMKELHNKRARVKNNERPKTDHPKGDQLYLPSLNFGSVGTSRFPDFDDGGIDGRRLFSPFRIPSPYITDLEYFDFADTSEYMFPQRKAKRAPSTVDKNNNALNLQDLDLCLNIKNEAEIKGSRQNLTFDEIRLNHDGQFMHYPVTPNNPYRNIKSQQKKKRPFQFNSLDSYLNFNKALQENDTNKVRSPPMKSIEGQAFSDTLLLQMMFELNRPATVDVDDPTTPLARTSKVTPRTPRYSKPNTNTANTPKSAMKKQNQTL
ncbi:unnamed protein product [Owenia fusiformis]|uniref:Uncharacterized protein n=1 Tax=Owenia fusiformis TaxID=6347 RepID=A0A8J1T9Z8_OWEFU|nr:unnamed protein product [Owenia fusiformis]